MREWLEQYYDIVTRNCGMYEPNREEWLRWASENAEFWPIIKRGELIGGVLFKGHTVHIAVKPEWQGRWVTKSMLRAYPLWKPQADVVAPIFKTRRQAIELAERLGFERLEETDHYYLYVKRAHHESDALQA